MKVVKQKTQKKLKTYQQVCSVLILGFCILFIPSQSYGQENIDLQDLVEETQKMSQSPNELTLVWWIPKQFWQASMAQDPKVTEAQVVQVLETISPYTMIIVVDGQIGAFGGLTYQKEESVRTSITIKDDKGWSYAPLSESAINPDTKNLLQMLKPMIANMLGSLGQNMHFILFPSKGKDGRPIADPTKEGIFNIVVAGKEFKYHLPLGSVLPPKYDLQTGRRFPGNYNYNPFTGSKLFTESPNN